MKSQNPRQIAIQLLSPPKGPQPFLEDRLERALSENALSAPDRALLQELVYGIVRWRGALDRLIADKTGGRPQGEPTGHLLRLGLYQMFWLDRIPDHAAVHETVELAKVNTLGNQAGFINAVLRGYAREKEATRKRLAALKETEPAVGFSHPAWLVERWVRRLGKEAARRLLEWNNTPPAVFARVNLLRTTAAELLARWQGEGIQAQPVEKPWVPAGSVFEISGASMALAGLASFAAGDFYVQDPSTLLSVQMVNAQPGERVLDFCAAPGGKTAYLAQQMKNQGSIVACDLEEARLKLLRQNFERLGITCATVVQTRALPAPDPAALFDKVLVDAPCSNTGVLRRRIELRWRLKPEELVRLTHQQRRILDQASGYVRPGGTLVYSTCSLEPEENGALVAAFIKAKPEWELVEQRDLTPFREGVDGAFVAVLRRKG